jgi:hypothetical protein
METEFLKQWRILYIFIILNINNMQRRNLFLSLISSLFLISCSKELNSTETFYEGNFKGGTLTWSNATASGTDPNFSFIVKDVGNNTVKVSITTSAPIPLKEFTLKLETQANTGGLYQYIFSQVETVNSYKREARFEVNNQQGIFSYKVEPVIFMPNGSPLIGVFIGNGSK